jgi:hypothetical protein
MKQPLFPGDSEIDEIFKIFRYVFQDPALAGSSLSSLGEPGRNMSSGKHPVMSCYELWIHSPTRLRLVDSCADR